MGKGAGKMKWLKSGILAVWIILFALIISFFILRVPRLWFLSPPEKFWLYLHDALGVSCCESAADVSMAVSLLYGLLLSLIVTLATKAILPKCKGWLTKRSSGR